MMKAEMHHHVAVENSNSILMQWCFRTLAFRTFAVLKSENAKMLTSN